MKEVEVKVKISSIEEVKSLFEEKGFVFSEPITQSDAIFTDPETAKKFDQFVSNINFLRIRKEKDRTLFTLKRPKKNELDCIEREVTISDAKQMEDMIEYMGYEKVVEVIKTRQKAKHETYEVLLDTVEGLGHFVEVEHLVDMDTDSEEAQKQIWDFLSEIGLKKADEVTRGYDTLMYIKLKGEGI